MTARHAGARSRPEARSASRLFLAAAGVAVLIAGAVALQLARDRAYPRETLDPNLLYVRSPAALQRLVLGFDALAADLYWIRAIQHYGGGRLARESSTRKYELLYPLLDITTSLDPYFNIAYRFGAIFLSEAYPGGPGRPDQAVALLKKGIANNPGKWQYYMDAGFVYYWHLRDYHAAADWFQRAARQPNAPNWLTPLAAAVLEATQDRAAARFLWGQLLDADQQWLRQRAERALLQLDALDLIDRLEAVVARNPPPPGESHSWAALVRSGALRGVPLDPARTPFLLDPETGEVTVSPRSPLFPMPQHTQRRLQ